MNIERIKLLESYVKEEPENPFNGYALAMEFYESDPDRSLALLLELTEKHPNYLPTYFKAAHLLWEKENYQATEKLFKKGIQLAEQQSDTKAMHELSSAYQNFKFEIN